LASVDDIAEFILFFFPFESVCFLLESQCWSLLCALSGERFCRLVKDLNGDTGMVDGLFEDV
jgi:hypothetical protein